MPCILSNVYVKERNSKSEVSAYYLSKNLPNRAQLMVLPYIACINVPSKGHGQRHRASRPVCVRPCTAAHVCM
jgi:hypothetical protein